MEDGGLSARLRALIRQEVRAAIEEMLGKEVDGGYEEPPPRPKSRRVYTTIGAEEKKRGPGKLGLALLFAQHFAHYAAMHHHLVA